MASLEIMLMCPCNGMINVSAESDSTYISSDVEKQLEAWKEMHRRCLEEDDGGNTDKEPVLPNGQTDGAL